MASRLVLIYIIFTITEFACCSGERGDLSHACADVTPVRLNDDFGIITSSVGYPQPENTTGCRMWYIQANPRHHITVRFDDLDLVTSDPNMCTGGQILVGPDPNKTLCGSLRHWNQTEGTYQPRRQHMWIKYLRKKDQVGRGFRLTYIIEPEYSEYCPESYFQCRSGACVLTKWVCNGAVECRDGTDEINCSNTEVLPPTIAPFDCGYGFFRCADVPYQEMRCFPVSFLCDGKPDCNNSKDEAHCEMAYQNYLEAATGVISSADYQNIQQTNLDYKWFIHLKPGSKVQIRFFDFDLKQSEFVEIHDGSYDGNLLARFDWKNPPTRLVESLSNDAAVVFHSGAVGTPGSFNATYQEKGVCLDHQEPCSYGERDCFDRVSERCDGVWNCPVHGGDERGCGICGEYRFSCGDGAQCYKESEHCNGIVQCNNKADERGCSRTVCGSHNGTFLCHNEMCIYQSWHCDGANDCGDNSDEINCPLSRKVVIAAVIGSTVCALLLTIALGCTCQLHALRLREQHNRRRYRSPLSQLQDEYFSHRRAPPNYSDAMVTSRPFDDARREFLEHMQADMAATGQVDLPSIVSRVTAPPTDNNNQPQVATAPVIAVPDIRPLLIVSPIHRRPTGQSEASNEAVINVPVVNTSRAPHTPESNVLVDVSFNAGITAHWSRVSPKHTDDDEEDTNVDDTPGRLNESVEVSSERSADTDDSALLSLSGSCDTISDILDIRSGTEMIIVESSNKAQPIVESSNHVLMTDGGLVTETSGATVSGHHSSDEHSSPCESKASTDQVQPSTKLEKNQSTAAAERAIETKVPGTCAVGASRQSQCTHELLNQGQEPMSQSEENRVILANTDALRSVGETEITDAPEPMEMLGTSDTEPLIP